MCCQDDLNHTNIIMADVHSQHFPRSFAEDRHEDDFPRGH